MRMPARQRCHTVLAGLITLATAAVLSVSVTTPAAAADTWTEVGSDRADPLTESQGLTSVEVPVEQPQPLHRDRHHPGRCQRARLEPCRRPGRLLQRLLR